MAITPIFAWAHGGKDPIHELNKNTGRLDAAQHLFLDISDIQERKENLESQVRYLQKNIVLVRNLIAKDYPYVTAEMSKYEIDYINVLDENLVKFNQSLEQMKATLE